MHRSQFEGRGLTKFAADSGFAAEGMRRVPAKLSIGKGVLPAPPLPLKPTVETVEKVTSQKRTHLKVGEKRQKTPYFRALSGVLATFQPPEGVKWEIFVEVFSSKQFFDSLVSLRVCKQAVSKFGVLLKCST